MTIERSVRLIAGAFVLISLALGHWVSPYWYLFTAFVGLNLFQSAFTNWCPMMTFLRKLGVEVVEGAVAIVECGADGSAAGEEAGRRADGLGRGVRLPWAQWCQFGGEFDDGVGGRQAEGFHSMEDARYGGQNQGESCDGECGAGGEGAHVSSGGRTPVLRPASTPAYLHSGWAAWEAAAGLGPAPQGFPS